MKIANFISRFLLCSTPSVADYDGGGRVVITATVNYDVLTEILLRLPAKSVIRFKSVCKHWLSIISGDQFRHLHTLRRHKPQPSHILCTPNSCFFYFNPTINGEKNPRMISYSFTLPSPKIWSSCNGLMLLQCDHYYYVYNPTTKQSRNIILDYDRDYPDIIGLHLAFDPSKSPHYKIICVRGTSDRSYMIEVYDSTIHAWILSSGPFTDYGANFSYGVHCNNSIYWKMLDALLYFDIDENVIGSLLLPDFLPGYWFRNDSQLQESNGHLYLITTWDSKSVTLWQLQRDDHYHHSPCWFLKYRAYSRLRYFSSLVRFINGTNGDETNTFVTHVPGKTSTYRFLDEICRACGFD